MNNYETTFYNMSIFKLSEIYVWISKSSITVSTNYGQGGSSIVFETVCYRFSKLEDKILFDLTWQ